jgi:hypothetical protein
MARRRESEICEVDLLEVPFKILFPPAHLGAKEKDSDNQPYEEKLSVSVWMKYETGESSIDHNWNWVPLVLWLKENDRKVFDTYGTLEELRDLITQRALKEPFEIGLEVSEITVHVRRTTDGIRALQNPLQQASIEVTRPHNEAAVICHTIHYPSQLHWGFDENPALPRGKYCPRPFASTSLATLAAA